MKTMITQWVVSGLLIFSMPVAIAGISLDSTRVIFHESDDKKGTSVGVTSTPASKSAYLIKAHVTKEALGENVDVPFLVSPSIFRLDSGSSQAVLIRSKGTTSALPRDRESVFYFRAIAIPSGKPSESGEVPVVSGSLEVAGMSVIKLFYRPANLPMTQTNAMAALQFSPVPQGLKVSNPTPYYITLNSLKINSTAIKLSEKQGNAMIAPFKDQLYPLAPNQGAVEWKAINDYGGVEVFNGSVQ